jgi:hypothetical protein
MVLRLDRVAQEVFLDISVYPCHSSVHRFNKYFSSFSSSGVTPEFCILYLLACSSKVIAPVHRNLYNVKHFQAINIIHLNCLTRSLVFMYCGFKLLSHSNRQHFMTTQNNLPSDESYGRGKHRYLTQIWRNWLQ